MTHRERILAVVKHQPLDRIPKDMWVTNEVQEILFDHFNISTGKESKTDTIGLLGGYLAKSYNIKVFHHNDGDCRQLIPNLVDKGIDILNPIQWVQSAGDDKPVEQWKPLIRKIQSAGKSVIFILRQMSWKVLCQK